MTTLEANNPTAGPGLARMKNLGPKGTEPLPGASDPAAARAPRAASRRAADQRDELTASDVHAHSMTSSARASSVSGTLMPSALAVLRLITSSYFVGACTGRSAGFSPLRMRST